MKMCPRCGAESFPIACRECWRLYLEQNDIGNPTTRRDFDNWVKGNPVQKKTSSMICERPGCNKKSLYMARSMEFCQRCGEDWLKAHALHGIDMEDWAKANPLNPGVPVAPEEHEKEICDCGRPQVGLPHENWCLAYSPRDLQASLTGQPKKSPTEAPGPSGCDCSATKCTWPGSFFCSRT